MVVEQRPDDLGRGWQVGQFDELRGELRLELIDDYTERMVVTEVALQGDVRRLPARRIDRSIPSMMAASAGKTRSVAVPPKLER